MRVWATKATSISCSATLGHQLWDLAGMRPSLDLNFAESKSLTDATTGTNLVTFTRASNGTYVDSDGIIQTAIADQPRFDHDPTTGDSLGLLIEESRTNILLNSATLSTQSVTTSATAYTLSFYGTGTVTLSGTSTAGPLVGTGANDRVTLTFTPTAGTLTLTVTGTVSNAQLEAGSFPTSYIPTTGTALTRSADVATITGSNFSSWYNQSEGTTYLDFSRPFAPVSSKYWYSFSGSNIITQRHSVYQPANLAVVATTNDGTPQATFSIAGSFSNKHVYAYKLNDYAACVDGGTVGTDTTATVPAIVKLNIGSFGNGFEQPNGTISRLTYFPDRLPDATLQAITAP